MYSNEYKTFLVLKKKINTKIVNDLVYERGLISIRLLKNCNVFIFNHEMVNNFLTSNNNIFLYDKNFEKMLMLLKGKKTKLNYGEKILQSIISLSTSKKVNDELYFSLPSKEFKKSFSKIWSKYNIKKELILFNNTELVGKYVRKSKIRIPKKGLKVKLIDASSYLFESADGSRFVDCEYSKHTGYHVKDNIFVLDRNKIIFNMKKDKYVLRKGVKLSSCKLFSVKNIQNTIVTLYKSNGIIFLKDVKGVIRVSHPDLEMYLIE